MSIVHTLYFFPEKKRSTVHFFWSMNCYLGIFLWPSLNSFFPVVTHTIGSGNVKRKNNAIFHQCLWKDVKTVSRVNDGLSY